MRNLRVFSLGALREGLGARGDLVKWDVRRGRCDLGL
jgi:hypothetical protein